ncbi:radical SAM protein [Gorillibacterium timonense]|uniref:radical SAM protein n=1 Tax=Gorillibacterium timonense TaxID=1689269 RepID=UPI00071D1A4E|nr:radical SAM protein [Gorillibacterium timonense]
MITTMLRVLLTRSFQPIAFEKPISSSEPVWGEETAPVGLYVHIPFCRELCPFCPYQKVAYDSIKAEEFVKALLAEIRMSAALEGRRLKISSVYFGGGTPALLLEKLGSILEAIDEGYERTGECGIELHPSDVTPEALNQLRQMGFTMVSLGIQSFQPRCLNVLGRADKAGAERVRLAATAGFRTIDVDLIFGMQGQTEEELIADFRIACEMGATQISTYPFIDFSYAHNRTKPLGHGSKRKLLACLNMQADRSGWERTSVWTFARRNTPKYSSITRDLFRGFGPSAVTLTRTSFCVNTFSVDEYIKAMSKEQSVAALELRFTKRLRALYWLFWSAYTLKLDGRAFQALNGRSLEEMFPVELRLARLAGLIRRAGVDYRLTRRGAALYHRLEQVYTHGYIDKTWKAAREDPWPSSIRLH